MEPEREETANQVATLTFIIDCVLHIETAFLTGDAVCLSGPNVADGVALWKRVGWVDNHLYTCSRFGDHVYIGDGVEGVKSGVRRGKGERGMQGPWRTAAPGSTG